MLVSPIEATAICRLSGLGQGTQTDRLFRPLFLTQAYPSSSMLDVTAPFPPFLPLFGSFATRLYFDSAPQPSYLGLDITFLAHRVLI